MAPDWIDMGTRMLAATAAGALLGFERSRQDRAIMGFRTLSLVGLASCIAVQAIGSVRLHVTGRPPTISGSFFRASAI